MRRYRTAVLAAGVAAIVAAVVAIAVAGPRDVAVPSPSPTSVATTAAPTPSASPSPSPTATPSPSPIGPATRYVSALLGYSIELPPPWHRSSCNGVVTQQTPTPFGESFVSVAVLDEVSSDIGAPYPTVTVTAEANPQRLSPRQWAEQRQFRQPGEQIGDTTLAGRPAVRITLPYAAPLYFVANTGRMYGIVPDLRQRAPDAPLQETIDRIVGSFRFLSDAEQAAARAALPTAAPPRTPEQVADGVAAAFAANDISGLETFMAPCVFRFGEQAGGTTVSRAKYVEDLRAAFAAGLVVTVQPRPFQGDRAAGNLTIASTWTDPRDPKGPLDRKLVLTRGENDRWQWAGTLERYR